MGMAMTCGRILASGLRRRRRGWAAAGLGAGSGPLGRGPAAARHAREPPAEVASAQATGPSGPAPGLAATEPLPRAQFGTPVAIDAIPPPAVLPSPVAERP